MKSHQTRVGNIAIYLCPVGGSVEKRQSIGFEVGEGHQIIMSLKLSCLYVSMENMAPQSSIFLSKNKVRILVYVCIYIHIYPDVLCTCTCTHVLKEESLPSSRESWSLIYWNESKYRLGRWTKHWRFWLDFF